MLLGNLLLELNSMDRTFSILGQVAAALTALAIIYRYLIKSLIGTVNKISEMYKRVNGLVAQFERNGGSSIRDSLDRIERAVIVQDQRQKIMLGLINLATLETNDAGKVIFVNKTYLQWTGRSDDEVLGDGWVVCIHPDDRDRIRREWAESVAESRSFESKFRMINEKGKCFEVFGRAYPMIEYYRDSPEIFGWFAIIHRTGDTDDTFALIPTVGVFK